MTATDEDDGLSSETIVVNVVNTPPHAYAGPTYYLQFKKSGRLFDAQGSYDVDGGPITYHWDFGDGNTSTGIQSVHEYALSENYNVALTVSDGASNAVATTEAIIYNTIPYCIGGGSFIYQKNHSIDFSGSGCSDPNGDTLSYSWDFGDGGTASDKVTTHTYTTSGIYTVKLVVNDGEEDSQPTLSTYTITNDAPIADGGGSYSAIKEQVLVVNGSGSSDADNDVLTYHWNFGDGITRTGASPSHVYSKSGRYKLSLIVNDGEVDSIIYNTTVSVKNR